MTNQPMTCDGVADQLASYLEGDLAVPERVELEAHASCCATCSALLADIDAIRREASALPALEPSRDLWSGIAARIDAPVVSLSENRRASRAIAHRAWVRPSLAAAALVLVTAGVTHYFTRASFEAGSAVSGGVPSRVAQGTPSTPASEPAGQAATASTESLAAFVATGSEGPAAPVTRAATTSSVNPAVRLASAVPAMKETQPVYDREIGKLRAIVKERRSQLDPSTIAVLEQSIAVIDSAIAQSRAALAKDPASGFLATQLNHSLEKKVELLRTAALLPSRT
jgi:anti-sigma factor ChrR (cupin superfamily)